MRNEDRLKQARNLLLKLHKRLIDEERMAFERFNGPLTAGQFLNMLLDNDRFVWLRKLSMLIAEIDEMFDLKDGVSGDMVRACLTKTADLVGMRDPDADFNSKYRAAIEKDAVTAGMHRELTSLVSVPLE